MVHFAMNSSQYVLLGATVASIALILWQRKKKNARAKKPEEWLEEVRAELYGSVLPFWLKHSFDATRGGFMSCVGRTGELYGTDKYSWLNGRAVWMTAEVCRLKSDDDLKKLSGGFLSHSRLLESSIKTAEFLLQHAVRDDGQLWFCLTREGVPVHLERKPFSAMFTCQGLACLSEVLSSSAATSSPDSGAAGPAPGGGQRYAAEARALLDRVLGWAHDPSPLGRPACAGSTLSPWNVPMIALSVLETVLASGVLHTTSSTSTTSEDGGKGRHNAKEEEEEGDESVVARYEAEARWCVEELLKHLVDHRRVAVENVHAHTGAYCPSSWQGRLVVPGHGVECAWFLLAWAKRVGDARVASRALELLEWSWEAGWDDDAHGGGLRYFMDAEDVFASRANPGGGRGPNDSVVLLEKDMKLWWPHAEAMVATLMAFEHTGEDIWWQRFEACSNYTFSHFSDRASGHGEWFGYCDRDGHVTHPIKGGPYKGCFHAPRALLMCEQMLERMAFAANQLRN